MIFGESVRLAAAHLSMGDELPSAVVPAAIPYFLVRLTTVCIERRELGVIREFTLRAIAVGFSESSDLAGFLGIDQQEMDLELDAMQSEMLIGRGRLGDYQLLEKGKLAIGTTGLPRTVEREAGCYVNGVSRRIEQSIGELKQKRKLPEGTLILPAVPARPPAVGELDLVGVRTAMATARNALPRILEVTRLGRVIRASNLFAVGQLMLRKGVHAVPIVCLDGAADSDLARRLGAHPALQALKAVMARQEKQVRHLLGQRTSRVRGIGSAPTEAIRRAITTFMEFADAEGTQVGQARADFLSAASVLTQSSHWVTGLEFEVLLSAALLSAKSNLLLVAPSLSQLLGPTIAPLIQDAVRRGVSVEAYFPELELKALERSQEWRRHLKGVTVKALDLDGNWLGYCCDNSYTLIGVLRSEVTTMGRFFYLFGALLLNETEKLLRDVAIKFGATVVVKQRRKIGQ